ncbi:MAG: arginine decarboxylase [Archaeoglobi archaeon]|nr:arginine decarboxylase [Archaeoglobi archaeon]
MKKRIKMETSLSELMIPRKFFLVTGCGSHRTELGSFEMALRDAGVERQNFVPVSSIIPPGCRLIDENEGRSLLRPGEITFCVMSRNSSCREGEHISASLSYVIPEDEERSGYLFEYHGNERDPEEARRKAIELAEDLCADLYDCELKIGAVGISSEVREWTTVLALAVFIL